MLDQEDFSIDHYHQNMFGFDHPNVAWVKSCAAYLKTIFPSGLNGKHVVDYGFGRGNWSLAFIELGAKHVTAIDASPYAIKRFNEISKANNINNLSIILGNTDDGLANIEADVVFLYGILHHVKFPLKLLKYATSICAASDSKVLVYSYNADSLRQTIVQIGRTAIGSNPEVFRRYSLALHPDARIRASDDLTAPHVNFWTNSELEIMLQSAGLSPISQISDFAAFEGKAHAPEFDPYVLIASRLESGFTITPQCSPNIQDLEHIKIFAAAVMEGLKKTERVQFAVGLFNTLFTSQSPDHYFQRVFTIWRYLVTVALSIGSRFYADMLPEATRSLFEATYRRHNLTEVLSSSNKNSNPEFDIASYINRGGFRL